MMPKARNRANADYPNILNVGLHVIAFNQNCLKYQEEICHY